MVICTKSGLDVGELTLDAGKSTSYMIGELDISETTGNHGFSKGMGEELKPKTLIGRGMDIFQNSIINYYLCTP